MDEEISTTLNLDLFLGPDPEINPESVMKTPSVDLIDLANTRSNKEFVSLRMLKAQARRKGDSIKCENGTKVMEEDNVTEDKKVIEKSIGKARNFFDCCICLNLSKEPVVTHCGHLHCWPCIYHWQEVSEFKNCPVCKEEISLEDLIPIYGCGVNKRECEDGLVTNIPLRPGKRCIRPFINRFMNSRS